MRTAAAADAVDEAECSKARVSAEGSTNLRADPSSGVLDLCDHGRRAEDVRRVILKPSHTELLTIERNVDVRARASRRIVGAGLKHLNVVSVDCAQTESCQVGLKRNLHTTSGDVVIELGDIRLKSIHHVVAPFLLELHAHLRVLDRDLEGRAVGVGSLRADAVPAADEADLRVVEIVAAQEFAEDERGCPKTRSRMLLDGNRAAVVPQGDPADVFVDLDADRGHFLLARVAELPIDRVDQDLVVDLHETKR
mmetsp:Transcript_58675/g.163751  ORF Transcript_58675/g.163751 Transcript_58675/m.163751 type:complete len:252 (-) Transcript_58675:333-1088(-)